MEILNIGKVIQSERIKKGLSQEDVSFGVCTTATLSRIERGVHAPNKDTANALLSKINSGMESSDNDIKSIEHELMHSILNNDYTNAQGHLFVLKEKLSYKGVAKSRFSDSCSMNIDVNTGNIVDKYDMNILKAIKRTIVNYTEDMELDFYLSKDEVILICTLADYYAVMHNYSRAISILEKLINCLKQNCTDISDTDYSGLLYKLSSYYVLSNDFEQAYKITNDAYEYCRMNTIHYEMLKFSYIKSLCEYRLGCIDKSKSTVTYAHYSYLALGQNDDALHLTETIKSTPKFDLDIELMEVEQ